MTDMGHGFPFVTRSSVAVSLEGISERGAVLAEGFGEELPNQGEATPHDSQGAS